MTQTHQSIDWDFFFEVQVGLSLDAYFKEETAEQEKKFEIRDSLINMIS